MNHSASTISASPAALHTGFQQKSFPTKEFGSEMAHILHPLATQVCCALIAAIEGSMGIQDRNAWKNKKMDSVFRRTAAFAIIFNSDFELLLICL
ncbi:hypothetical protein CRE_21780 [Caenorhabditis remanei]|uniref:Uncharacterized protein n=1 Tax=Caenorhabditis remanei TaxID=31234 RepID=E3MEF6_CAERE|nr:hypothetical protein CRE_21780 [Caenorhabditis remanei]